MNVQFKPTQGSHLIEGPIGSMEILVDVPSEHTPKGVVLLAHPQPLLGGSAHHKVPHYLAKALATEGWLVIRPNFRGVGGSAGQHDRGDGEAADLIWLVDQILASNPGAPIALVGISFGAFVQAKVAAQLQAQGAGARWVILAAMPSGTVDGGRTYDTPQSIANALVIHGELDDRVPLSAVFEWARSSTQVVSVIPGSDHLFTGRLTTLRNLVIDYLV